MLCNSCENADLTAITPADCEFNIEQLAGLALSKQKLFNTSGVTSDVGVLQNWTDAQAIVGDGKVIVLPLIKGDPQITGGQAITSGGNDNSTFNGEIEYTGQESVNFSFKFKGLTTEQYTELKDLNCLDNNTLFMYLFSRDRKTIYHKEIVGGTDHGGISIGKFFVGPRQVEGIGVKDYFDVNITMDANWEVGLQTTQATDFDTVSDLII